MKSISDRLILKLKLPLLLGFVLLLISGCETLPALPNTPKYLARGTSTSTPFQPRETFTSTPEEPPTLIPSETFPAEPTAPGITASPEETPAEPTFTPTVLEVSPTLTIQPTTGPTLTSQPTQKAEDSPPVVRVSVTTNCRTGPGVGYTRISSLSPGKKAVIVGQNPDYPYWVIQDPWNSGSSCWLWNYYASTQGDLSNVALYTPPAAPTAPPTWTPTPTLEATDIPGQPTSTAKPPTATSTPQPPTATREVTPGTPTDTPTPAPTASNTPVPPPTATASSPYCSYTSVLSGEEDQIRSLINQARRDHGLPALKVDSRLVTAARDHGRDMTCNGLWSHDSSDGTKSWERISVALGHSSSWCYTHCCCAEIFYGGGGYLTPSYAFNWWMNHESQDPNYEDNIHKRTILSQYTTHLGVGVIYYQKDGTVRKFYTVDFARP
ncbi:MAG: CAP domain-containing protein [Anaerolineales bacterium]|nr:CAP domain-containing protein [Anaerolineales bacterium]